MDFETIEKNELIVVGIALRTSNDPGKGEVEIPAHWNRFYEEGISAKISSKVSDQVIALYTDYEGDHTDPYTLIIGHMVDEMGQLPEGLVAKKVPAQKHARFPIEGAFPQALVERWQEIWKSQMNRAYIADFELYPLNFGQVDDPAIELFIGV